MMERNARQREIDAFQKFLDSHGSDRTRWPAAARLRFATLTANDSEARRRLAEAQALDRLLDQAPMPSEERRGALIERIVASAKTQPPQAAAAIVPVQPRNRGALMQSLVGTPVAALLAASLLLGIFVGVSGAASPALQSVATISGLLSEGEVGGAVAGWDDPYLTGEEETL